MEKLYNVLTILALSGNQRFTRKDNEVDEEKSRVGRKGEDCTMLHVTLGHYHNRQATSHPKAMPHHHIRRQIYNIFHTSASSVGDFGVHGGETENYC